MAKFCPLFSGSDGNCVYIGTGKNGILIDAGRSAKQITEALKSRDIPVSSIRAIFVTHEHIDHTRGLQVFAGRNSIPVYATDGTILGMKTAHMVDDRVELHSVNKNNGAEMNGIRISFFHTSHDTIEPCGYIAEFADGRKAAICTDLGVMTDEVRCAVEGCDLVLLESNHDVRMLENGPYPYYLKRRILGEKGHLCNEACSQELVRLADKGTSRIFLGHLSRENNTPELALESAVCALTRAGYRKDFDYSISACPPVSSEKVLVF